MAIAERTAQTVWEGTLAKGRGTIRPTSGAWQELPVTWAARTERPDGKTSPEELAAAAHSACFAMALTLRLSEHQVTADRLSVTATVTLDEVDGVPTIVSSALRVRGRVPGTDRTAFRATVDEAAALCPVSRLFAGATITVDADIDTDIDAGA
jgi:osmotically inducible protein OsmC